MKLELAVELGLARIHVAQRAAAAALERLNRVVRLAQAKSFHTHPIVAASIYGELLATRGDAEGAARVWLMASGQAACDDMDRQGALTLLHRLALPEDTLAQARRRVPALAEVLAEMHEQAGGPVPGNGGETPAA